MPRGITLLLVLVFLYHISSFLLVVDSRHVRISKNNGDESGGSFRVSEVFELSGRENVTHRRAKKKTAGLSDMNEHFINCTLTFDVKISSEYARAYVTTEGRERMERPDISLTSFRCPTLASIEEKTQSRGDAAAAIAKLEQLTRGKRGTFYRDDTEVGDAQKTEPEGDAVPAEGNHESEDIDEGEDSKDGPENEKDQEINEHVPAEDNYESKDIDEAEDPKDGPANEKDKEINEHIPAEDKHESKEIDEGKDSTHRPESVKDKEIVEPTPEVADDAEEVTEEDQMETESAPGTEKESEAQTDADQINGDREDSANKDKEKEDIDDKNDTKDEDTEKDKDDGKQPGEEAPVTESDDVEHWTDSDLDGDTSDEDPPELAVSVQLEWSLSPQGIWNFILDVADIVSYAGDYIISLLLRNLKRDLSRKRMHDKFKNKLRKLTESPDHDRDRAVNALTKKIRKQFGRSYELQVVRFLRALRDGLKS